MERLVKKDDLLEKLREYRTSPDDENIYYKQKIKNALLTCPELLYALHEEEYEDELFDDDGNINWNPETHEPYGEWSAYFGENSNIRPELFIPETQTNIKHFICYQVSFDDMPKYNSTQKYMEIKFNIFCKEGDILDELTGIPRHDLIASIIRERINWSNLFGAQAKLISSKESVTDNHYVVRTIIFQVVETNGIYKTTKGKTSINNYQVRR